nr:sugar transporter [Thalassovita aquimarina]
MKHRHWGLLVSFVLAVLLPLMVTIWYLWAVSIDQYASTTGFTVRKEEAANASDIVGGLAQFAGGSTGSDTDILYEFIQSQELVNTIDARLDVIGHYSAYWGRDPLFSLWPSADAEDLLWYWQRVVRISYDQSSGLIELRVLAFEPDYAQKLAQAIVDESQKMINALSAQAREDAMRYARADLDDAVVRLKKAREALTSFRTRTQIVDPESDLQGRMGVLNNLQQQLAQALIEYDLLVGGINPSDPRLEQAQKRIQVIRERIAAERANFATDHGELGQVGEDYPNLIAEYESLTVDREFAEETYRASLAAVDVARANASRQSRYLATYVRPTSAESSEFPRRFMLAGLTALFLVLGWSIIALIYYSIRDRH